MEIWSIDEEVLAMWPPDGTWHKARVKALLNTGMKLFEYFMLLHVFVM